MYRLLLVTILLGSQLLVSGSTEALTGRVIDARTLQPIADVIISLGDRTVAKAPRATLGNRTRGFGSGACYLDGGS